MALKEAGHTVAANYVGNDEAARKFRSETGIAVYRFDVADFEACEAGIKRIEQELGPIDILVNNAGITRDALLHKMTVKPVPSTSWSTTRESRATPCCTR